MKKTLILMVVAIILGGISGMFLFNEYKQSSYVFNEDKNLYFIEEGVYATKESLDANTKDINPKLVINNDNKYHVYVGITGNINNAYKIKKMYKDKGYSVYEKKVKVDNSEFISNISQFDILLDNTKNDSDISTIQEVILSNYEDLVK